MDEFRSCALDAIDEDAIVGVMCVDVEDVERGGVGRAEVVAVGVDWVALEVVGGVPCTAVAASTEAGTSKPCDDPGEEAGGPDAGGPLRGCGCGGGGPWWKPFGGGGPLL